MKIEAGPDLNPTMDKAIQELAATIEQSYPEASFRVSRGEDDASHRPIGRWLSMSKTPTPCSI